MSYEKISVSRLNNALNKLDNIKDPGFAALESKFDQSQWSGKISKNIIKALKKNEEEIKEIQKLIKNYKNISNYIDGECGHKNESNYSLYGIGNHVGSLNFGHYYAYIKLNDRDWYEYNDSSVHRLTYLDKNSTSAYVLFYKLNKYYLLKLEAG